MIGAPPVAVVLDGREIASSQPALLRAGAVVVPLDPYLRRLASQIVVDPAGKTITFVRANNAVTVTLGERSATVGQSAVELPIAPYLRDGLPIIPLGPVARGLGFTVTFDGRSHVVSISSQPQDAPLATMTPYVPQAGASPFATPRIDDTPTPRPSVTGIPWPRRTPIEVRDTTPPPGG